MIEKLTSLNNPKIKQFGHLSKARERKAENSIIIEGFREVRMAVTSGFTIKELYICNEIARGKEVETFISGVNCRKFELTKLLFEKIAYRENSDGIIAIAEPRYINLSDISLSANPLIMVLESVEKPGNLGALLRTSDAAHLDAIVVCDSQTDIYNPNVIRSSLGCIFTQQVVVCSTFEAIDFFRKNDIKTFAAALTADAFYHETDLSGPAAIVMGTEADGLTDKWMHGADYQIKIPMLGKVDSLNVSTSAAILVYEALRQRGFNI
jgi:RNA methyltransferase, TrmH family